MTGLSVGCMSVVWVPGRAHSYSNNSSTMMLTRLVANKPAMKLCEPLRSPLMLRHTISRLLIASLPHARRGGSAHDISNFPPLCLLRQDKSLLIRLLLLQESVRPVELLALLLALLSLRPAPCQAMKQKVRLSETESSLYLADECPRSFLCFCSMAVRMSMNIGHVYHVFMLTSFAYEVAGSKV
eukprot:710786-Hanusia_phi.AAC.3